MSLKEWTFRVYNGLLKLARYEIYECTKCLLETGTSILPNEIQERLIISHMSDISKYFKLLRPRYLMCLALKLVLTGHQRSAKFQFANAIRLATELRLYSEMKNIDMIRKQIFRVIKKSKSKSINRIQEKKTKN